MLTVVTGLALPALGVRTGRLGAPPPDPRDGTVVTLRRNHADELATLWAEERGDYTVTAEGEGLAGSKRFTVTGTIVPTRLRLERRRIWG